MARWSGKVGYEITADDGTGVARRTQVDKTYYGDLDRMGRRLQTGEGTNDSITLSNEISLVADAFAYEHFHDIRYVEIGGALWEVTSVQVGHPRLILSIGGVYHRQQN